MGAGEQDLAVKVHHCGQTKRTTFPREALTFETLSEWIETSFGVVLPINHNPQQGCGFPRLVYRDPEGDTVTISSTNELLEAINLKAANTPLSLHLTIPRPRERWHRFATAGGFAGPDHPLNADSEPRVTFSVPSDANEADNEATSSEKKSEAPSALPRLPFPHLPANYVDWETRRRARLEWRTAVAEARRNGLPIPPHPFVGLNHPLHRACPTNRHPRHGGMDLNEEMLHEAPAVHPERCPVHHPVVCPIGAPSTPETRARDELHYLLPRIPPRDPPCDAQFGPRRFTVNSPSAPWCEAWSPSPSLAMPPPIPAYCFRTPWAYTTQAMGPAPVEAFSAPAPPAPPAASAVPAKNEQVPFHQHPWAKRILKDHSIMRWLVLALISLYAMARLFYWDWVYTIFPIVLVATVFMEFRAHNRAQKVLKKFKCPVRAPAPAAPPHAPPPPPMQRAHPATHAATIIPEAMQHHVPFPILVPSASPSLMSAITSSSIPDTAFTHPRCTRRVPMGRERERDAQTDSSPLGASPPPTTPASVLIEPHNARPLNQSQRVGVRAKRT